MCKTVATYPSQSLLILGLGGGLTYTKSTYALYCACNSELNMPFSQCALWFYQVSPQPAHITIIDQIDPEIHKYINIFKKINENLNISLNIISSHTFDYKIINFINISSQIIKNLWFHRLYSTNHKKFIKTHRFQWFHCQILENHQKSVISLVWVPNSQKTSLHWQIQCNSRQLRATPGK